MGRNTAWKVSNGIVIGLTAILDGKVITFNLPDKYMGEGNDIATNVLFILLARYISEKFNIPYETAGDKDYDFGTAGKVVCDYSFPPPPPSDDEGEEWDRQHREEWERSRDQGNDVFDNH